MASLSLSVHRGQHWGNAEPSHSFPDHWNKMVLIGKTKWKHLKQSHPRWDSKLKMILHPTTNHRENTTSKYLKFAKVVVVPINSLWTHLLDPCKGQVDYGRRWWWTITLTCHCYHTDHIRTDKTTSATREMHASQFPLMKRVINSSLYLVSWLGSGMFPKGPCDHGWSWACTAIGWRWNPSEMEEVGVS